jgi:hypothetical protein
LLRAKERDGAIAAAFFATSSGGWAPYSVSLPMDGGATSANIETGQTKNLLVALTDDRENYAVNWIGQRSKFIDPDFVPIRE